jgi:hypothetical protein
MSDDIEYFDQLALLVDRLDKGQIVFGLKNAEKALVLNPSTLFLGRKTVVIYDEEGAVVTFPFDSICSAQILPAKE